MLAPSSTILNMSGQNYHTMLTTEPLDTANIVDVPAEVIHIITDPIPIYLFKARVWWFC